MMKKHKFLLPVLLLIVIISFPNKIFATQYFDLYFGNISWIRERVHLTNFAFELKYNPEMIGYIAFKVGTKENGKKINFRIARMKKYLFSKYDFDDKRIVFVISSNSSESKETVIILQPISRKISPPTF